MNTSFEQVDWTDEVAATARHLIQLATSEDVADQCDWTTTSLVPPNAQAKVAIVARKPGVLAGLPIVPMVFEHLRSKVAIVQSANDGESILAGQLLATIAGPAADILTAERIFLNFLGHLSGIATLTRQYVDQVAHTSARVYDTRKTTPGWRLLEKYAVRQGGGCNHRLGLHRAVMIKDNHVALAQQEGLNLPAAIEHVRNALDKQATKVEAIEAEVDTLAQLEAVLPAKPDIVLLDNMTTHQLADAVAMRNNTAKNVVLEASGGVTLETISKIAETGVERISVGALTHSAPSLDLGLDWHA